MEKHIVIIGQAVIDQIIVGGKFGNNTYTASQLMDLSLESLDSIYVNLNNLAEKQKGTGLINRTKANTEITRQLELVEAIFLIKKEQAAIKAAETKSRKEKAERLAILNQAKGQAEIDRISRLSPEQIDAEIAALEA